MITFSNTELRSNLIVVSLFPLDEFSKHSYLFTCE
jgi:hypothetical protein